MGQMRFVVSDAESGTKLADFLKGKLPTDISAKQIKKMIDGKSCRLNGKVERFASVLVGRGDIIEFTLDTPKKSAISFDKARVVHEDKDLLIYDKPPGVASDDPKFLAKFAPYRLLHRLDKETSGLLMFAKSEETQEAIIALFKRKKIEKFYLALVHGAPTAKRGVIDNFLGKVGAYQGQSIWGEVDETKGLHAVTEWELERKGKNASLLLCKPITGRTHQIRVHLSSLGHPIVGDVQYGKRAKSTLTAPRCMLHAAKVSFEHPGTHTKLSVEAALPDDFVTVLEAACP